MKRLCVFCGSSRGERPDYITMAETLGRELVARGIGLVYGGAKVGTMGAIADTVLATGGSAIGVIPAGLALKEVAHEGLTELHVVDSMHARKQLMAELSDGFIALPGGLGTFEELFEVLTWSQLGVHTKPCGVLSVAGYFDLLEELIDQAVREGFLGRDKRALLMSARDPAQLLDRFQRWVPPPTDPWLDRRST